MSRHPLRTTILSLAAALVVAAPALAQAQERKGRVGSASPRAANPNAERAAGVILKVERVAKESDSAASTDREKTKGRARQVTHRITINTAAVWRDWARDQDVVRSRTPRGEAAEGSNSIATKGEPADKDTLVVVGIAPETEVHTRFRLVTDESSRGYRTPEEARRADDDPASGRSNSSASEEGRSGKSASAPHFRADDLKAGLYVEVDFRRRTDRDVASEVTVIRPVAPAEK